jgi:hypothetical protein
MPSLISLPSTLLYPSVWDLGSVISRYINSKRSSNSFTFFLVFLDSSSTILSSRYNVISQILALAS